MLIATQIAILSQIQSGNPRSAAGHDPEPGEQQEEQADAVADGAQLAPARVVRRAQAQRADRGEEQEGPDDVRSDFDHGPPRRPRRHVNVSMPAT